MSGVNDTTHDHISAIFSEYNRLRGRGNVERGRLNRALGLDQTGADRPYDTTIDSCDCPDSINRPGVVCKHRAALRMRQQARAAKSRQRQNIEDFNELFYE